MKNILIKGKPGSGKTTAIIKIINALGRKIAGGFYTQEIRKDGIRTGFIVKTIDGKEQILSHIDIKSGHRVGKYGVDVDTIDKVIVDSILSAITHKDIIIIDEIGRMEMCSNNFKSAVVKALDSSKRVLASIPVYTGSFLESIKSREDVEIFYLDMDNRDNLVKDILIRLKREKR
jgi:nucleoside-triphosphatase